MLKGSHSIISYSRAGKEETRQLVNEPYQIIHEAAEELGIDNGNAQCAKHLDINTITNKGWWGTITEDVQSFISSYYAEIHR